MQRRYIWGPVTGDRPDTDQINVWAVTACPPIRIADRPPTRKTGRFLGDPPVDTSPYLGRPPIIVRTSVFVHNHISLAAGGKNDPYARSCWLILEGAVIYAFTESLEEGF